MGKKERENLKTCMNGSYVSLCKHSWLTPQQAQDVKQAERKSRKLNIFFHCFINFNCTYLKNI